MNIKNSGKPTIIDLRATYGMTYGKCAPGTPERTIYYNIYCALRGKTSKKDAQAPLRKLVRTSTDEGAKKLYEEALEAVL